MGFLFLRFLSAHGDNVWSWVKDQTSFDIRVRRHLSPRGLTGPSFSKGSVFSVSARDIGGSPGLMCHTDTGHREPPSHCVLYSCFSVHLYFSQESRQHLMMTQVSSTECRVQQRTWAWPRTQCISLGSVVCQISEGGLSLDSKENNDTWYWAEHHLSLINSGGRTGLLPWEGFGSQDSREHEKFKESV